MSVEVVAYWSTLIRLAREEADAREAGDPKVLAEAEAKHQAYREVCLTADRLVLPDPLPAPPARPRRLPW